MTHDELLKEIKDNADYGYIPGQPDPIAAALIAVVEYAKELSRTDYRGNSPIEHYIGGNLMRIIEKELM